MKLQIHWRVHRSAEVLQYLIALRDEGSALRAAINQLITNGLPKEAVLTEEPNTWEWVVADHWVTCVLEEAARAIYVTDVERVGEAKR